MNKLEEEKKFCLSMKELIEISSEIAMENGGWVRELLVRSVLEDWFKKHNIIGE